ncbi:phage tail protein [Vibrio alginolyticus]|uniref:phage tail-collar fiber domain-containing protein n=1 Tax=Vibrio alginolyticus TaxID=663 RepID=UPI002022F57E|nr:phage tail protein [Vibrio alginolyticus]
MANTTDKSILTAAGKALLAQLNAEEKPLIIDKMIFANVPNRPEFPQPDDVVPTDHVVHQEGVEQRGRLSADSVIYSTTLTSNVGPFEFNWTGAYCSEYGVLVTIDHHALTPKSADEPGVAGNTLVRSVVLEYKDIAEITNITVDASSWQYNATPRMKKMDDDVAQAIIDQNGKDWFIEDGFLVTPQASAFNIKAGAGYASGNRVTLEFDRNVQVPNKPSFIYVDAHREGTPTGEQVTLFDFVVTADEKDDYTDANGVKHFVCKIAQVLGDGSVSDLRPEGESASRDWVKHSAKIQSLGTTIARTLSERFSDVVNILDFGAIARYEHDSTFAIDSAIYFCHSNNKTLYIPSSGVFKYIGSLDLPPGIRIVGDFAPQMQPFPIQDEKIKMKDDGSKNTIVGSCIIFSGGANKSAVLENRDDDLHSFTYMVKTERGVGTRVKGVAFIQDMVVVKSDGAFTSPEEQNEAPYDVGHYIDDAPQGVYEDLVIFGYFPKAGRLLHTRDGFDDPDYNTFRGGSVMGRYGVAFTGSNKGSESYGMSGTQTYEHDMFTLDHHSRSPSTAAELYKNADSWRCVYIDGDVDATSTEINGFYFNGGTVRTWANHPLEYDHASNVHFHHVVFESPKYGIPGSDKSEFIASKNCKREMSFHACRFNDATSIFNDKFAGAIGCPVLISGDPVQGLAQVTANPDGGYSMVRLGADGGVGDPSIQFTDNVASTNSRWKLMADVSNNYALQVRYENSVQLSISTDGVLTADYREYVERSVIIDSGTINIAGNFYSVATESGASTDNLVNINGGAYSGQTLILRPAVTGKSVFVRHGAGAGYTGNIRLNNRVHFEMTSSLDRITLQWNGTQWCEISRSKNE